MNETQITSASRAEVMMEHLTFGVVGKADEENQLYWNLSDLESEDLARILQRCREVLAIQAIKDHQPGSEEEVLTVDRVVKLDELLRANKFEGATLTDVSESRSYLQSDEYGETRYHIITSHAWRGTIIEQDDLDEKYQERVTFTNAELPALTKFLLRKYLDVDVKPATPVDDGLGDLDDHPF